MTNKRRAPDSSSCLYALYRRCCSGFVFVNKIQVKGEEQKVEGEKVCDAAVATVHGYWINGIKKTGYVVLTSKIENVALCANT